MEAHFLQVLEQTTSSVTLSWPTPVEQPPASDTTCSKCQADGSLLQYASRAWSPSTPDTTWLYGAGQATGASFTSITKTLL